MATRVCRFRTDKVHALTLFGWGLLLKFDITKYRAKYDRSRLTPVVNWCAIIPAMLLTDNLTPVGGHELFSRFPCLKPAFRNSLAAGRSARRDSILFSADPGIDRGFWQDRTWQKGIVSVDLYYSAENKNQTAERLEAFPRCR